MLGWMTSPGWVVEQALMYERAARWRQRPASNR